MTNHGTELSTEAMTEAIKQDDTLREDVRAELRAQPIKLAAMYLGDLFFVLMRTASEVLAIVATVFVWAVLVAPGDITAQVLHSSSEDSIRTLACSICLITFIFTFSLRAMCGALSKTYASVYSQMYEARRADARLFRLVESVLKRHGLLELEGDAMS